jgi:threonyl-tRNA synthetase
MQGITKTAHSTEILIYLQNQTGHKAIDRRRLGSALKVLGFQQKSIHDGHYFFLPYYRSVN